MNEGRCDEKLKTRVEETTCLTYTGWSRLLWIKKERCKDKTYIWVSVWWKTWNQNWDIYTTRIHWVVRGTRTPKDKDEVNRRVVSECDGWVCVFEVIGVPSIFKLTRKTVVLARVLLDLRSGWPRMSYVGSGTVHGWVAQVELLELQKNGQFPHDPVRITV
jgi:hypothetical protein